MWKFYLFKTSFPRLINVLAIWLSYQWSKVLRKPMIWGVPIAISVEPTTACNLRCPECPSGLRAFTRATGNLKWPVFQQLIDELASRTTAVTFYFQGEPFIHPQLLEMIKYAGTRRLVTITSTNGHFISRQVAEDIVNSKLDRLIISIDGLTQETYEKYRVEGQLQKVLDAAKFVTEAKKRLKSRYPYVVFQFIVFKHNEHEIPEIKTIAKQLGVNEVQIKSAQIYHYEQGNELIPEQDTYSRYKKNTDHSFTIKNPMNNHCWRLWHSSVISWDGQVVPCCFDKDASHVLGNISDQFLKVWRGEKYQSFRQRVLHSRKSVDICTNCSEGLSVFENKV